MRYLTSKHQTKSCRRSARIIALILGFCLLITATDGYCEAVPYMPGVTKDMTKSDYWVDSYYGTSKDADKVLASAEELKAITAASLSTKDTYMTDLINAPAVFNGKQLSNNLVAGVNSELSAYIGKKLTSDGSKVTADYIQDVIDNAEDPNAAEEQPVRYGIAVKVSSMLAWPTDKEFLDDKGDLDFDNKYMTAIRVNEPVLIKTVSKDKKFYYVTGSCCSGFAPASDIAICSSKDEWLSAWNMDEKHTLTICKKMHTEASYTFPEISNRLLTMGTKLELIPDDEIQSGENENISGANGVVSGTNRSAYNNYVVYLPVRNDDGSYSKQIAFISENRNVHEGTLSLTTKNILDVALNALGDTYGWGGMLQSDDCSGYVRDIYACFGLDMARNTNWQRAMPVKKYSFTTPASDASDEEKTASDNEKKAVLDILPPGSVLYFSGHEMLYLGKSGDSYYVISAVSTIMNPDSSGRQRVRSVIINDLDTKRANGNTWLRSLADMTIPYYAPDHEVSKPSAETAVSPADSGELADYGKEENWAYYGIGEAKDADVFLVCPTVDTKSKYNMSLSNEKVKKYFYNALEMERGIYEDHARLFAPYYRQAAMPVYMLSAAEREQYLELAYKDVSQAFRFYLENENKGRPVILAGFSQGADMCLRIMKEYFAEPETRKKLVATYAIGWSVTEKMTKETPCLIPAKGEDDYGTIVSFDCEGKDVKSTIVVGENEKALSINPLNWKTDSTPADKSLNKGACFMSGSEVEKEEKGLCGCYIDEKRGALKVTDINSADYDSTLGGVFPEGSYHIYDYQFFYRNLQENVGKRLASYMAAGSSENPEKDAHNLAGDGKITGLKKNYVYTGKAIKPQFKIVYNGGMLESGKDYKVSYSKNKNVGKALVKISGVGDYSGILKKSFRIIPKGTKLLRAKRNGKNLKLSWKVKKKQVSGYEIRYSMSKRFPAAKTKKVIVKNNSITKKTIRNSKTGKRYYIKIRTYKMVGGKKYSSKWSGVKKAN